MCLRSINHHDTVSLVAVAFTTFCQRALALQSPSPLIYSILIHLKFQLWFSHQWHQRALRIDSFPQDRSITKVTWIIRAQDNADNAITTLGLGYEYQYQVIPEFPITGIALLLFMISTLLAATFHRRKRFDRSIDRMRARDL